MNISILTVFPCLYDQFLATSLLGRAHKNSLVQTDVVNFFEFAGEHERIDSPTYGHSAGMLIKPEVVEQGIERQEQKWGRALRIFFSPHGQKLDQRLLEKITAKFQETNHLLMVAGRYEGIDARVEEEYADIIISLGDFVLMGGDLAAMIVLEGCVRLLPHVVGNKESTQRDSFAGAFVDYPEYTAPAVWRGKAVPEVVRSGNHAQIEKWRQFEAVNRTIYHHFNWLKGACSTAQERRLVSDQLPPHYVVLMHEEVMLPEGKVGTTSVTSFDLHDVARSCRTFGIKNYFLVTPLLDQQEIVKKMLEFWQEGAGIDYNSNRHEALKIVQLKSSLHEVCSAIEAQEGNPPLLIATSARRFLGIPSLTYYDQTHVWARKRPILFVIGTGKGLSSGLLERCDYILAPILGFADFNHLSVRAAVSIILDRWLGINVRQISADHEEAVFKN